MTREEAITVLKGLYDNPLFSDVYKAAFNIAIHDIKAYHKWNLNELVLTQKDNEQETVSKESYDHEYFLRKEFELKIDKLQRQLEEQESKGHWIANAQQYDMFNPQYICSECGNAHTRITPYCEMCGAKMVEPQEGEGCTK